jgi:tetraprenyl-beta-curcumene synthase
VCATSDSERTPRRTLAPRAHTPPIASASPPRQLAQTALSSDRRLALAANVALVAANLRYWSGVARQVRGELSRWRALAAEIEDPLLGGLAREKLAAESFNAEAAAMLATRAPRRHRAATVRAIVALEVLYDYLDGLTEQPRYRAPGAGEQLFAALTDAVSSGRAILAERYLPAADASAAESYLRALVGAARSAISQLPAAGALRDELEAAARRGGEAQLHIHRAASGSDRGLERWARREAVTSALEWREYLAGAACSVLAVHALLAAAADPASTREHGARLARAYLSISVLPTTLDALLDHGSDSAEAARGILAQYPDAEVLAARLCCVAESAWYDVQSTPHAAHHAMIMLAVLAYYASAPGARSAPARSVLTALVEQRGASIAPALAVLRAWRAAKRLRARRSERGPARSVEAG